MSLLLILCLGVLLGASNNSSGDENLVDLTLLLAVLEVKLLHFVVLSHCLLLWGRSGFCATSK